MYKCLTGTLDGRTGGEGGSHPRPLTSNERHANHELTNLRPIRNYDTHDRLRISFSTPTTTPPRIFLSHIHLVGSEDRPSTSSSSSTRRLLQTCMPHTSFPMLPTSAYKILSCLGSRSPLCLVFLFDLILFFSFYSTRHGTVGEPHVSAFSLLYLGGSVFL